MAEKAKRLLQGCAIALAFFALVEGVLWGAGVVPLYQRADPYVGFAGWSPLFVERTTSSGELIYETSPSKLQWFNPQRFPVQKAEGVTRVFCLGGSTTYGRPYDDRTSFCGWLREFLPAADPERRWEVINAGGISYASYRVIRLMDALSEFEPDLFIIYTGHNEFLEKRTYSRLMNTPQIIRDLGSLASRMRLYSVMSYISYDQDDILATDVQAVLDQSMGPEDYHRDDVMRDAVLEHFRTSIERMTRISDQAGAQTIFVTPASNIADFSPFKSESSTGLSQEDVQRALDLKLAVEEALDVGDPTQAAEIAAEALALDPRNAELLFLKGRALRAVGRVTESRIAFISARDEDVAPLRALTPIPGIIADVARQRNAGLVDFARMVDERSPNGIPGSELFLDHVHPTIEGNRILALALLDEMSQEGLVSTATTWNDASIAEITERVNMGVDEEANELARKSLANVLIWAGKHEEAERLVDLSVRTDTADGETYYQKATILRRAGQNQEALPYYAEAVRLSPGHAAAHRDYGVLLSELGRTSEAKTQLEAAARLNGSLPGVHYDLGVVLGDLGENVQAEAAYRLALRFEPNNPDTNNNLGILLAMRGDIAAAVELFSRAVSADPGHENAIDNLAQARALMNR